MTPEAKYAEDKKYIEEKFNGIDNRFNSVEKRISEVVIGQEKTNSLVVDLSNTVNSYIREDIKDKAKIVKDVSNLKKDIDFKGGIWGSIAVILAVIASLAIWKLKDIL